MMKKLERSSTSPIAETERTQNDSSLEKSTKDAKESSPASEVSESSKHRDSDMVAENGENESERTESKDDSGSDIYQRDENGNIKTDEEGNPLFLPNHKFDINGVSYETDDNGNVYKVNGELLPNSSYNLNGRHYETNDKGEIIKHGGSYKDVKKDSDGETSEVHHMPADSASNLDRNDGPAIKMDKEDHKETASCGNSKEAQEYRAKQRELIEQGKFREALQMDIDDIREKFADKYDDAIAELLEYVDQLEAEGKI